MSLKKKTNSLSKVNNEHSIEQDSSIDLNNFDNG